MSPELVTAARAVIANVDALNGIIARQLARLAHHPNITRPEWLNAETNRLSGQGRGYRHDLVRRLQEQGLASVADDDGDYLVITAAGRSWSVGGARERAGFLLGMISGQTDQAREEGSHPGHGQAIRLLAEQYDELTAALEKHLAERCDQCNGHGWVPISGKDYADLAGYVTVAECQACNPDTRIPYDGRPAL